MAERAHRAGVVALLGRPNAGKSTLLNALVGEKLAIVTDKPQTTRSRILGILAREDAQVLLVDTPGLHAGARPLNLALNAQVGEAADSCDAALLLIDPREGFGADHAALLARVAGRGAPLLLVATKADAPGAAAAAWPPPEAQGHALALRVSARSGEGLPELVEALVARLPEGPALYPQDQLSDRPVRFLAAELVREAAFDELAQELPYALAVEVVEFDESRPGLVRIRADLLLERASQKQIVIGRGGAVVKRIGVRARREIEALLGTQVHLDLWVKHEPNWGKRPKRLKSLGYS
jgi:GTP-binding protein Era